MDVVEDFLSISLLKQKNAACSDNHEMIRLKNGIAQTSCARERKRDKKIWPGTRKTRWNHTVRHARLRGDSCAAVQVLCTAAAIDNVFNIQVIPHRSKRTDKVKWEEKWGHILGWLQEWREKDPTAFRIQAPITEQMISQSFVRIDLRLRCLKHRYVCVCACALVSTSVHEWVRKKYNNKIIIKWKTQTWMKHHL